MFADGAYFRSFLADIHMAAITAFPTILAATFSLKDTLDQPNRLIDASERQDSNLHGLVPKTSDQPLIHFPLYKISEDIYFQKPPRARGL